MWYVVQVRCGTEDRIRLQCERRIDSSLLQKCFIPEYEEKRKQDGRWMIRQKHLFPGYVFVVTDDMPALFFALKSVIGLTKMIGVGTDIIPLTEDEVDFINRFGGEAHIVKMSEGIIEGGQIRITGGPLMGMEGTIRRIDRHKRKAWIEITMFSRLQIVEVGLEVVSKT